LRMNAMSSMGELLVYSELGLLLGRSS
jgi:hypothetical protein